MIEKLQGYKTYVAIAATVAWVLIYARVPGVKDAIAKEDFAAIFVTLAGAAGVSLRAGVAKAEAAAKS